MSKQDTLDIVNEYDEIIGIDTRENVHNNGLKHREIVILVINDRGEILLQKRGKTKIFFPGFWSLSVAGHVDSGDSYIFTAIKELEEENGIIAKENELIFLDNIYREETWSDKNRKYINNIFINFYVYKFKDGIDKIKLEKNEAEELKWFKIDKLFNIKKQNNFLPHMYDDRVINMLKKLKNYINNN